MTSRFSALYKRYFSFCPQFAILQRMARRFQIPCSEINGRLKDTRGRWVYYVDGSRRDNNRERDHEGYINGLTPDSLVSA